MKKALCFLFLFSALVSFAQVGGKLTLAQKYVLNELTERLPVSVEEEIRQHHLSYYADSTVHFAHRDSSTVIRTEGLKVRVGEKILMEEFDSNNEFTGGRSASTREFESGRIVKGVTIYDTNQTKSRYSYTKEGALRQVDVIRDGDTKAIISWIYPDSLSARSFLVVPNRPADTITNSLQFFPSGKIKLNESFDENGALVNSVTYAYDEQNRLIEERAPQLVKLYAYGSNDSLVRSMKIIGRDTVSCNCTYGELTKSCTIKGKTVEVIQQETIFNRKGRPISYVETKTNGDFVTAFEQTDYTYTRSGKPLSIIIRDYQTESTIAFYWDYSKNEKNWVERHLVNGYPISVRYVVRKY